MNNNNTTMKVVNIPEDIFEKGENIIFVEPKKGEEYRIHEDINHHDIDKQPTQREKKEAKEEDNDDDEFVVVEAEQNNNSNLKSSALPLPPSSSMMYNQEEITKETKPKEEAMPQKATPFIYFWKEKTWKRTPGGTVTTKKFSIDQQKQEQPQDEDNNYDYGNTEESSKKNKSRENEKAEYSFYRFVQKQAMRMARYPKLHFWVSFIILLIISIIGLIFGNFTVTANNTGWTSRGTTISEQFTQILLLASVRQQLFSGESSLVWEIMQSRVSKGWETSGRVLLSKPTESPDFTVVTEYGDNNYNNDDENILYTSNETSEINSIRSSPLLTTNLDYGDNDKNQHNNRKKALPFLINRNLQQQKTDFDEISSSEGNGSTYDDLLTCDWDWYTDGRMDLETNLYPIWKIKDDLSLSDDGNVSSSSALDSDVIREICTYEQNTLQYLEQNRLCSGCDNGKCLMPYSIVLYVRSIVPGGMFMDCNGLANAWENKPQYKERTKDELKTCVDALNMYGTEWRKLPDVCGETFYPSIVDTFFHTDGAIKYTSSIFSTIGYQINTLYKDEQHFDRGGGDDSVLVEGVYDTVGGRFQTKFTQECLIRDILLGISSGVVTVFAILLHTRSPFLTFVGVLEILFSFPLAYFTYYFVFGFEFFPFLNFIGIFVVFALGADHIFVAVDKWKNARIKYQYATTEQIAAIALPEAAAAMFLTTTTTSIAFFATAICRVAPIRVFGIFCGLLIVWDYIVDILLIFPCLCIYDKNNNNPETRSICFHLGFHLCSNKNAENDRIADNDKQSDDDEEQQQQIQIISLNDVQDRGDAGNDDGKHESLIHRILIRYYSFLHKFRWLLLVASISAICICGYYSSTLKLPSSSEIVLLNDDIEYIQHSTWRKNIFIEELKYKATVATTYINWGARPADTGDLNNPQSWSTVELDNSFDPSSESSQIFLRDFCPSLFEQEFAMKVEPTYECAMNKFDYWLQEQSNRLQEWVQEEESDQQQTPLFVYPDPIYMEHCANATGLPIPQDVFHPCIVKWSKSNGEISILALDGIVKTIDVSFLGRAKIDSPNRELHREYNLIQNWISTKQSEAPEEISNFFFGSVPFWNYDTQTQMFRTAFSSALTALAVAAIVILLYSRSITMMVFSVLSIAYVLVSVTSVLVAIGWSLGFLESICFSILIGISVDFVIHFSHAYVSLPEDVDRNERTKHALIHMGPSILAAAFTTLSGSTIMLFTRILFFQKFGIILCLTVIQAVIGSFVVFLTLTDCFGPSDPTYMVDSIVEYICSKLYGDNSNTFYTRGRYSQGVFSVTSSMRASSNKLGGSKKSLNAPEMG